MRRHLYVDSNVINTFKYSITHCRCKSDKYQYLTLVNIFLPGFNAIPETMVSDAPLMLTATILCIILWSIMMIIPLIWVRWQRIEWHGQPPPWRDSVFIPIRGLRNIKSLLIKFHPVNKFQRLTLWGQVVFVNLSYPISCSWPTLNNRRKHF